MKVLGTVFNVNAYPEGEWVRTTLVEGKVEAVCGGRLFVMEPGMQVAYSKGTGETEYKKVVHICLPRGKTGIMSLRRWSWGNCAVAGTVVCCRSGF